MLTRLNRSPPALLRLGLTPALRLLAVEQQRLYHNPGAHESPTDALRFFVADTRAALLSRLDRYVSKRTSRVLKLVVKALSGLSMDVTLTPQETLLLMVVLYRLQTASTEAGLPPELQAIERSYSRKPGVLKMIKGRLYLPEYSMPETDLQELAFIRRCEQFANSCYHSNPIDFARDLHLKHHDVLVSNLGSTTSDTTVVPSYALALDRSHKTLFLAIRGTYSLAEVLINFTVAPEEFSAGYAHRGMLVASEQLLHDLTKRFSLDRFFAQHPDYRLVCTGHSFGAAAAALLAMMLRVRYAARAVCFCPPSCVSKEVAETCHPFVTSIINGDDAVPRFHFDAVVGLKEAMKNLDVQKTVLESLKLDGLLSPAVVAHVLGFGVGVSNAIERTMQLTRDFFELLFCPVSHWGDSLAKEFRLFDDASFFLSADAAAEKKKKSAPSLAEVHAKMPRININWKDLQVPLALPAGFSVSSLGEVQVHLDGARQAIASTVDSAVNAARPAAAAIARKAAPAVAAVQEAIANRNSEKQRKEAAAAAATLLASVGPVSAAQVGPAPEVVVAIPGATSSPVSSSSNSSSSASSQWSMSSQEEGDGGGMTSDTGLESLYGARLEGEGGAQPASQAGRLAAAADEDSSTMEVLMREEVVPPAAALSAKEPQAKAATIAAGGAIFQSSTTSTATIAGLPPASPSAAEATVARQPEEPMLKWSPSPTRAAAAGSYIPSVELSDLETTVEADRQVAIVFKVSDDSTDPAASLLDPAARQQALIEAPLNSDFAAAEEEFVAGREADCYGSEDDGDAAAVMVEWTPDDSGPTLGAIAGSGYYEQRERIRNASRRVSQASAVGANDDEDDSDSDDEEDQNGGKESKATIAGGATSPSDSSPKPAIPLTVPLAPGASAFVPPKRAPDRLQYYPPGSTLYLAYPENYERQFVLQEEKRRLEAQRNKRLGRRKEEKAQTTSDSFGLREQDLFPDYQAAKAGQFSANGHSSSRVQDEWEWEDAARKNAERSYGHYGSSSASSTSSRRSRRRSKTAEEDIVLFDADDDDEDDGAPDSAAFRHRLMRPVGKKDSAWWRIARDDLGTYHGKKKQNGKDGEDDDEDEGLPSELSGAQALGGPGQKHPAQERLYSPPFLVDEHGEPYYGPVILRLRDAKQGPAPIPEGSLVWPPPPRSATNNAGNGTAGSLPLAGPLLSRALASSASDDGSGVSGRGDEDEDDGYGHVGGSAGAAAAKAAFAMILKTAKKAQRTLNASGEKEADDDDDDDDDHDAAAGGGPAGGLLAVLGQVGPSASSGHTSFVNMQAEVDEDEDEYGDVVFNRRGSGGGSGGGSAGSGARPSSAVSGPIVAASLLPLRMPRAHKEGRTTVDASRRFHGALPFPTASPLSQASEGEVASSPAASTASSQPASTASAPPPSSAAASLLLPDKDRYFNRFVLSRHMLTDHLLLSLRAELDLWIAYLLRNEALAALRTGDIARSQSLPALLTSAIKKSQQHSEHAAVSDGHGHKHEGRRHSHKPHQHSAPASHHPPEMR